MATTTEPPPADVETTPWKQQSPEKPWHTYISEDLPRTISESTDSAFRSARSLQDFVPEFGSKYRVYEDAFFSKVKDELRRAREHPFAATGLAITAGFVLMRGPRRFLIRNTLGRLQSEETKLNKASKNLKELELSVQLMKKESEKLLERAALAEKEMIQGRNGLMSAGAQIQSFAKSVYKVEREASGVMDLLREIPGREALKLRAEVASMSSFLKDQRTYFNKKIMKISELGVRV